MQVTLYSKPGCLLCDELKIMLMELQAEVEFALIERNIEADAEDFARYRYLIPVLDIEGGALLYPPHTWDAVRNALYAARGQAR
ncbi:MAG TPA: glutaredoxin [Chloroflexi bacterium]|nr:glutaredoxin [Chloroflexota bacterium]HHW86316.1 glutaredoxin family protein [Chloroflexota bacterium]